MRDHELCESDEVRTTVEAWKVNPATRGLATKYLARMYRLAAGGPLSGGPFKKLRGDLWEFDVHTYRVFYGFASGNRVAITSVVEKKRRRLPPRMLDHGERRVRQHIDAIEAMGDRGCPMEEGQ